MLVVDLAVSTRQPEAVRGMNESAVAYVVYAPGVDADPDIDGDVETVFSALYLASYLLALPLVPVGDVRYSGCLFKTDELTVFAELVFGAALGTSDTCAAANRLTFSLTLCAFVEDAVESVGAEALCDSYSVLLLPLEIVEAELLEYQLGYILCRGVCHLL